MTSSVYVWVWLPSASEPVPCGVLESTDTGQYRFRYGNQYLQRSNAVALAPDLPLDVRWFYPPVGDIAMPGALRDAAPDAWGRRVVLQGITRSPTAPDVDSMPEEVFLLHSDSDRFGALDFQTSTSTYTRRGREATLDELANAAELVQRGVALPPMLMAAALRGTSMGGARPKAILGVDGVPHLAKLSTSDDPYPVVQAEAAALTLAKAAGLSVPDHHLEHVDGHDVLLIRRFDRNPDGTRRMAVSGLTLLRLGEMTARYGSYPELLAAIDQVAADPVAEAHELFSRIAFNIAISNTDDHLRNHAAFWDGQHLTLTPAFDLTPGLRSGDTSYQAIPYGPKGERVSNFAELQNAAAVYGLTVREARNRIDDIIEAIISNWDIAAEQARLTSAQKTTLRRNQILHPSTLYGYTPSATRTVCSSLRRLAGNDALPM